MSTDNLQLQPLLTFKQASVLLGLPDKSLRHYIREHKIPYLRIGRLIRFDPLELQAWLDARRVREAREEFMERQERRDFKGWEGSSEDENNRKEG